MYDDPAAQPRKIPTQARSKRLVASILEATARVLRTEGARAASTNHVAKVAGVSVGSLYQYFPNKDSLILALAHEHSRDQIARLAVLLQEAPLAADPAELARRYVAASIAVHKEDPALHLALTTAMVTQGLGRALADHRAARELVQSYLEAHTHQLDVPHPRHAAWILVTTVDMLIHTALFEDPALLDDPSLEEEIVRLVVRYVGATGGSVAGEG